MRGGLAALALALAMTGCTTDTPNHRPAQKTSRAAPAAQPDDGLPLGTLPRQDLAAGQCALFLWKAGNEARLVLMARTAPAVARIMLGGRLMDLARTNGVGENPDGLFANAVYSDGATTVTVEATLERRPNLQGGAVVTNGSLRLDQASGESFVMPAAGLLACR
ncbi:hypothetical protein ACFB49_12510 [Sphingomonas sp. DBB INV C78]|uniref:hypothetical protein n=1 Tax=Sphingomonas sp. DBB INV C78 TaxID=3349434 RepID=UPI0036D2D2D7